MEITPNRLYRIGQIEQQYGAPIETLIAAALERGTKLDELAHEWRVAPATVYRWAHECGFRRVWVRDGARIEKE